MILKELLDKYCPEEKKNDYVEIVSWEEETQGIIPTQGALIEPLLDKKIAWFEFGFYNKAVILKVGFREGEI